MSEYKSFVVTESNRREIGWSSRVKELVIPETFVGEDGVRYRVTAIGKAAFMGCSKLTSVKVPEGVMTIGRGAFAGCLNLARVEIPSTVKTIDVMAFAYCFLLREVDLPEGLEVLGQKAFEGCRDLQKVRIPGSVWCVATGVFSKCAELAELEIGEGVRFIEDYAFSECRKLKEVKVPEGTMVIKLLAWYGEQEVGLATLAEFHARYESIHPFQDGNGRTGRLILFRECLVNGIAPFVIEDENRQEYLGALRSYRETGDCVKLVALFEKEQKVYWERCSYFQSDH